MRLELEGIGASLQSDDGYTVVKHLVPGGVADKDGRLKVEDKIVGVGQADEGPIVDVVDMKLNDVVKLIRGTQGTIVRLEVLTPAGEKKILKMTRQKIELKDSEAQGENFRGRQTPRRHALQNRRDRSAQFLHGHDRRTAREFPISKALPATSR